ncbi:MAG TPA: hypothetical protein VKU38_02545 [Ktedonobacteraceae bacterium]|nr:hypothetical protein [Ktedonobacteraceae bacterium]
MKMYSQRPLPLFITSVVLAILMICLVLFYGVTTITRGPLEILLALLLGAVVLFVRALTRRNQ